uniref:Hypothetical chloroplast RF34 n=1 Tax=Vicia sativa TaxID=3908 RepID=A0A126XZ82_VICSA|nr:hypothetical chloroplast RF34 [Vicia sativa]
MTRSRINGNLIDKTFTIVANILLRIIPTTSGEKEAFTYYERNPFLPQAFNNMAVIFHYDRDGMSAQSEGNYAEALQNYYEAMRLEIDPYDRSYILYNIGLIHTSNGELTKALDYYFEAISEIAEMWFDLAAEYWKKAIALTPGNYIEAQNWLKITGRFE